MENENVVRSVRAVYVELVLKNCSHAPHMENNYVRFRWNFESFILVRFRGTKLKLPIKILRTKL